MDDLNNEATARPLSRRLSARVPRDAGVVFAVVLSVVVGIIGVGLPAADGNAAVASFSRPTRLGTLDSPALGQPIEVFEGVASPKPTLITAASVDVPGAVHIPQSALAGGLGVSVIAAHRTTWPRPFYYLDRMHVGDRLTYTDLDGRVTSYRVVETKIVHNDASAFAEVMNNEVRYGSDSRLTLYGCSRANGRPTSTRYRLVVFAVKVATSKALS